MNPQYFEKIMKFLSISQCVECVLEHSRYSIGCQIDVIIESNSTIGLADCRYGDEKYATLGVATSEQMEQISELTIPQMTAFSNSLIDSLPV